MHDDSLAQGVTRLETAGKTIYLVGTAHVSEASVALAEKTIRDVRPDSVAIELCESRFQALRDPDRWKRTDIVSVIRTGRSYLLLAQLMLAAFQRKLGKQVNAVPGAEMLHSAAVADEIGVPIVLADRDVRTTLKRVWRCMGLWQKGRLFGSLLAGAFSGEKISAEEVERMKQSDVLHSVLSEIGEAFPVVRRVLIDERDIYLAEKIRTAPGNTVVAVMGAGHVPGISRAITQPADLAPLEEIPPPGLGSKLFAWSIPALVVALVIYGGLSAGAESSAHMAWTWALITGISAAVGAALALSHPLTIATAFVTAPFTSLHPLLASGWFAGLTEALLRKPLVDDLENALDDMVSIRGLWRNRLCRILLVVALTNLLGSIGAFVAIGRLATLVA